MVSIRLGCLTLKQLYELLEGKVWFIHHVVLAVALSLSQSWSDERVSICS
jgi:hypothetical protein